MPGQSIGCILATLHCVQGWCHDMPHGGLGSSTRGLYNRIESFFPCIRTHFPLKIPDRHKIFRRRGSFHSSVPPLSSANPPPPTSSKIHSSNPVWSLPFHFHSFKEGGPSANSGLQGARHILYNITFLFSISVVTVIRSEKTNNRCNIATRQQKIICI